MIIKLGIIGFGGMGKWHAQNAPRAGVEIAAVCDIAEEKQKEAIEMGYRLHTNADELLADPEVNTVILTVPNYLHKEMCIKAAKAGKNVITEKPAAMSVQELDEMEAACKEAGVFFTSHQNRRWDKDMLTVKKAYDALEEEGFVITIHGKGSFVAFADQELMLEEKKKEVEADLEMAIRKGKSCGMTDQELLELFQIVLED